MFRLKPKKCILEVSALCNLRCQTCTRWQGANADSAPEEPDTLSVPEIKALQSTLPLAGIEHLTYLGAEPFMNRELLKLAGHARQAGLRTAVVTNGTLLTEPQIAEILDQHIFAEMIFSLDGPHDVHNNIRGAPDAFERTTRAIKLLQRRKKIMKLRYPKVFMYVTVSALNCDYIKETYELAGKLDVNAVKFFSASCVSDSLRDASNLAIGSPSLYRHSFAVSTELKIPPDHLPKTVQQLAELSASAKTGGARLMAEEYLLNGRGAKHCVFLGNNLVIGLNGDVYPCPMLPQHSLGNVRRVELSQLLQDTSAQTLAERLSELSCSGKLPICAECCVEKLTFSRNAIMQSER